MTNSNDSPVPLQKENQDNDDHQWDGSESEFVEDDDATDYEERHTGIKLSYTLKYNEIYSCLTHARPYKEHKKRLMIEAVILAILSICFLVNYAFYRVVTSLILGTISILFLFVILLVSSYDLRRKAKFLSTGKFADVEIYPKNIVVSENDQEWEISLDGSLDSEEYNNMILIYLENGRVFILPLRCVEPDLVADVQAMVLAGTSQKNDD